MRLLVAVGLTTAGDLLLILGLVTVLGDSHCWQDPRSEDTWRGRDRILDRRSEDPWSWRGRITAVVEVHGGRVDVDGEHLVEHEVDRVRPGDAAGEEVEEVLDSRGGTVRQEDGGEEEGRLGGLNLAD